MKQTTKIQLGVMCFIAVLFSFGVVSFLSSTEQKRGRTLESDARIVAVEPRYTRESDGTAVWDKIQTVSVVYRYEVGERKFERKDLLPPNAFKDFKVEEIAKVCYNPQNSDDAKLFAEPHDCGK